MSYKTIEFVLGTDLADAGTFTVAYPSGFNVGDFSSAVGHYIKLTNGDKLNQPADIGLAFGSSSVTVTNRAGYTIPAGTKGFLTLQRNGKTVTVAGKSGVNTVAVKRMNEAPVYVINLGAPITADADGICASQAGTASTAMTINGALASSGTVTFDVPRNVVGAWTNSATLTITGTDEYGNTVVETSASSGTSHTGKKAFKTITSVVPSANITGATVGSGDVLGLPVHLPFGSGQIVKELEDNAVATAGTTVAGLTKNTESTATTADVRGTYDPNSACDGAKAFSLVVALFEPEFLGNPQYAG